MNILYWGYIINGYRQESFQRYANNKKFRLNYGKEYLKSSNKYMNFILQSLNDLFNIPKVLKSSIIYIPPMEHTITKLVICIIFRKKVLCDIYAPHYDMTVNDEKLYTKDSPMAKLYYFRDKIAMKKSTITLFLNEAEKVYFCHTVDLDPKDVNARILPLVINKKPFAKKRYFSDKTKKLNISWTGSYIPLQGLSVIIDAVQLLTKENLNFVFNIIGPHKERENEYKQIVIEKKLSDYIKFIPVWGNMEEWEKYISEECDISLGIFGDSEKARTVVANKVIDGIAFKLPVITGLSQGINYYFDQVNDIFTVNNTPQAIAQKIIEVSTKDTYEIEQFVENAYHIYEDNFSEHAYENKLNLIFEELE